jgi:cytochrome c oxidase cbb3-type subunit 4
MYMEILRSIVGIEAFPVISLILFVVFFSTMLIRVLRLDRARVSQMAALPLDGATSPSETEGSR